MESPAALLKSAAFEEDAHQRTDKVIKACKIITDLLPYDKKTQVLIEEQDLMKYLMLTLPLNPRAVDLIIITMMDKFKKVNYFLKETWTGFLAIAQMEEGEAGEKKKLDDPLKLLGLGIKSILKFSLTKEMDELGVSLKPVYNQQITSKRDSIKLTVLGYVEKFLVTYITELRTVTAFKPDIADLTKKFIAYTTNETIVNKTAAIIEKLKGLDPELDFDNDFEEAILSKKDPQSRSNTSRTNLEESKHEKAKNAKKKSRTSAEIASVTNTQSIFQRNKKPGELEEVEENKSSEEDISEEAEEDENETEPPGTVAFDSAEGSTELEEWLSDGKITDIPLISKSEFAQEFIQDETNFDIIFGYLFDPRTQPVSDCWKQRHPYMSNFPYEKEKPLPLHPNQKEALAIAKLKEYKQLHPYALRSFKTIQMLCDDRNYREILDSSSLFIGRFFQELHKHLSTKDDLICNLNHIVAVMEYFLIKEPVLCMTYILHYNLIYKLFQNIELYSVQRILLTIFNCCPNTHDIGHDLYWKVLDYCKFTSIFADMSKAVLDGEKTFPKEKFKVEYKPEGMKDLVDIARDSLQLSNNPVENWSFTHDRSPNFILEDSKGGFGLDIDLIADELQKSKPINKKDLIKKNKSPPRTASKLNLKRYPSLAEKHYYDEPEGLANSSTAVKASEYADTVIETQKGTGKSGAGKAERQSPSVADSSNRTSPSKINLDTPTTKVSDQKTSSTKGTPAKVSIVSPSKTTPANATPSKVGTVTSPNKASTATPTKAAVTSASKTNITSPPPQKPAILIKEDVKITSPVQQAPKEQPAAKPVPSQTALKEQSTPKQVTPVQTPTPKDLTLLNPRKVEDEKLDEKTRETRPSVANLLKKDIAVPDAPTKKSIGTLTRITDKPEKTEPAPPEKKSWAKEFDMEVLGKKELEHLNELYPTSTKNMSPTALDREAKKPEYKMKNIRAIDQFSLDMCEFFDLLFQKMIMNSDSAQQFQVPTDIPNLKTDDYTISLYRLKRRLGASTVNQEKFWKAVFINKGEFFRNILTNYLIKIKIHHFDEMNSGYASGLLVNTILTHCMTFDAMQPYANDIQNISRENFPFLCKTLIQSTAWVNRPLKVYLQDYEVQEPLGTGRLALAKTLSLIILNDGGNNYDILNQMNDTCWHTLIIWFFTKRTNGLYHQIFYSIIQIAFLHTNEKTILNILFKLNLLSYLYKTWNEIYQNNVLLKENHVESVFCYLKKFTQLIEHTIKTHEHYTTLAEQIETSVSWGALKSKLLYRAKEKKKTGNTDKNKPKSKGHGPIGTPSKGTRQDFLNTTATSIRSQQGSSPVPGQKGDSPTSVSGKKILGK